MCIRDRFKAVIDGKNYMAFIKVWPTGLIIKLQKLRLHYEIVLYTILPRQILNEIFEQFPGIKSLIDHSLCQSDLVFTEDIVYKDLALLDHGRITNLQPDE